MYHHLPSSSRPPLPGTAVQRRTQDTSFDGRYRQHDHHDANLHVHQLNQQQQHNHSSSAHGQSAIHPTIDADLGLHKRQKAVAFEDFSVNATPSKSSSSRSNPPVSQSSSQAASSRPPLSSPVIPQQTDRSLPSKPASVPIRDRRNIMLMGKGRQDRRDRTFVGCFCAACEEPLEHTLRGERILQLSCGHVSHEACFYEYIKEFNARTCPDCDAPLGLDSSRGAFLDFENLNRLAHAVHTPDHYQREVQTAPPSPPWDEPVTPPRTTSRLLPSTMRHNREHLLPEPAQIHPYYRDRSAKYASPHRRSFSESRVPVVHQDGPRVNHVSHRSRLRNDYDSQSTTMTTMSPPRTTAAARNPVPSPIVSVRSEFPSIVRARTQQSLTCLITVEVVDSKWRPHPDDLKNLPTTPPTVVEPFPTAHIQERPQSAPLMRDEPSVDSLYDESRRLQTVKAELRDRVDEWHGLNVDLFGPLILQAQLRVGKDRKTWQNLECFLFTDMLICVKQKTVVANDGQQKDGSDGTTTKLRCTLKGSILIKKHLRTVDVIPGYNMLSLGLTVPELPEFYLEFVERRELENWHEALLNLHQPGTPPRTIAADHATSAAEEDEPKHRGPHPVRRASSAHSSSHDGSPSLLTAPTEYSDSRTGLQDFRPPLPSLHVPLDIVVVIPASPSMHGLKIDLLRDSLHFLVSSIGERDRLGLVSFGSAAGGVPLVSLANKQWAGWSDVLNSIRPSGERTMLSDVVQGANTAMDLLMQRQHSNSLSHIILISDCASSDASAADFVVSRAEAAKVAIHSFGLGLTHRPDVLVDLSSRTKAGYVYVKDWMMLRECLAGCLGALQSTSHQNAKLTLRLPEGSPARIVKISGAIQVMKRSTGQTAEASLGDLRFGDKRDILVQLAIQADSSHLDTLPSDPWEHMVSNLEALGPLDQDNPARDGFIEEVPLLQADLSWGDILRDGQATVLPRPSLLAITMLPAVSRRSPAKNLPPTPPVPPHPSIVQRRMEILTSDMFSRALSLISRGQHERARHILAETRSILKGLAKGGLPFPLPPPTSALPPTPRAHESTSILDISPPATRADSRVPSPHAAFRLATIPALAAGGEGLESEILAALDADLCTSLEYMTHPAVFARDSRKAVLQAIGVVGSQRACTFRSRSEALYAARIPGVCRLVEASRAWREDGGDGEL